MNRVIIKTATLNQLSKHSRSGVISPVNAAGPGKWEIEIDDEALEALKKYDSDIDQAIMKACEQGHRK